MKKFGVYQWVEGVPMTERDKQEIGSKFWNEGKWENYVLPFIEKDVKDMTFIDVGCNAGIFLREAKNVGFRRVIGIESDRDAFARALNYRERIGGHYEIYSWPMEPSINKLPVADYTILANVHYYFLIDKWLNYLDALISRTRYCIIVTADKKKRNFSPRADLESLRQYFKLWQEVGSINNVPLEDDPYPRKLYGICFKSPLIEREQIDKINLGNKLQIGFYKELDKGIKPTETEYYKKLVKYRKNKEDRWPKERIINFVEQKAKLFKDVKETGIMDPLLVNSENRIVDGNHRGRMIKYLGFNTALVRRVP